MADDDKEFEVAVQERFKQLPPVVQRAILSADVEKRLRLLAETHKLHIDQWETLEEEVQYALMGFKPAEQLADNIRSAVGVDQETAASLAEDISKVVFEPIRAELERELEHPGAEAEKTTEIEDVRTNVLSSSPSSGVALTAAAAPPMPVPAIAPATPPPPPVTEKAVRAPVSASYRAGETSAARANVHDDPYRVPPL
ncbi:MAG TPA: hypothetical protein VJB97_04940 [Candidatus Paceibacterota bacterium]